MQEINLLIKNIDTLQSESIRSISKRLTLRNWIIGYYIVEYEQNGKDRASYRKKLIITLSDSLSHLKGMSATNLRLFRSFYLTYPQIQQTVSVKFKIKQLAIRQITSGELQIPVKKLINTFTFSHFIEFLRLDTELKRIFYEVEAIKGNWSIRELKRQINSQVYERTALSVNKQQLIDSIQNTSESLVPQQIIKDPYILEFTGLEQKIKLPSTKEIEDFIENELGKI